MHLLRASENRISSVNLASYDLQLRRTLSNMLGQNVEGRAWQQVSMGVSNGGLGFRRAEMMALPALTASRVEAGSMVNFLAEMLSEIVGMNIMDGDVHRTECATAKFLESMPPENEVVITSILDEAKRKSFERFEAMGESARPRVDEQNLGKSNPDRSSREDGSRI